MAAGSSTGWMNDGGLIGSGSAVPRSPSLRSMRATLKPDPKRSVSTVVSRTGCGSSPSISPSLVAWAAWSPGHTFIRTVAGKPRAIHTTTRLRSTRRRIGPASTNGRAIARHRTRRPRSPPGITTDGCLRDRTVPYTPIGSRDFTCRIGVSSCTLFVWPPSAGSSSSTGSPASRHTRRTRTRSTSSRGRGE